MMNSTPKYKTNVASPASPPYWPAVPRRRQISEVLFICICGIVASNGLPAAPAAHAKSELRTGRLEMILSGDDWSVAPFPPGQGIQAEAFGSGYPQERAIPARVPGDIHWDLERAGILPNLYYGTNSQRASEIPRQEWWYRKVFRLAEEWADRDVRLRFDAVDYSCRVWLNGRELGRHEGQFTPFEFRAAQLNVPGQNEIVVLIEAPPAEIVETLFLPRNQQNRQLAQDQITRNLGGWKSRTATGWDWGTPMYTMGIWQDVRLIGTRKVFLDELLVFVSTGRPYDNAKIRGRLRTVAEEPTDMTFRYCVRCITADAPPATRTERRLVPAGAGTLEFELEIDDPMLWWPNGTGPQHLYTLTVTACEPQTRRITDGLSRKFGIRELQIVPNPDAKDYVRYRDYWTDKKDDAFAPIHSAVKKIDKSKTRKYLIRINGQRVFSRGGNWLPADLLYGRVDHARYEHLIRMAALANYNTFRVWGGGLIEKQAFYDLCDAYGIMVWQEMPNAGRRPLETAEVRASYARQQRRAMPLFINHPCIVRYGFGNELYVNRSVSSQVAQFEDICRQMHPACPVYGPDPVCDAQRHGPHWFRIPAEYDVYNQAQSLTVGPDNPLEWTEYGASGASSVQTLKRIIPLESLWPIEENDPHWTWHNGFRAYIDNSWLMPETYRTVFGELPDLEMEVRASQFVQAEGLRYANQAHRRKKWHRSACVSWTFNEPWPNAAHGCIVEYYGLPKMAFYYTRGAYAGVDVSAEYAALCYDATEPIKLRLFVTSDRAEAIRGCKLQSTIMDLDGNRLDQAAWQLDVEPKKSQSVGQLTFVPAKNLAGQVILVQLQLQNASAEMLSTQTYTFGITKEGSQDTCEAQYRVPAISHDGRRNLALAAEAKASARSVISGYAQHKIEHLKDGWFGNEASWIQGRPGSWAQIDLGSRRRIARICISNDNTGKYTDRGATHFKVLVATEYDEDSNAASWRVVAESRGQPLRKERCLDFEPLDARWVRIVFPQGQGIRLDEIQVYEADSLSQEEVRKVAKSAVYGPKPKIEWDSPRRDYLRPLLAAPETELELSMARGDVEAWGKSQVQTYRVTVGNRGSRPALFVELRADCHPQELYIQDSYFCLLPNGSRKVKIMVPAEKVESLATRGIRINAKAWNAEKVWSRPTNQW